MTVEVSSFAGGADVGGGWIERVNPARTDELVGRARTVDAASTWAAVEAAHAAFEDWRRVPAADRVTLLRVAADRVAAATEDIAPLLAAELGKVVGDCRGELLFAAAELRAVAAAVSDGALDPRVVDDEAGRLVVHHDPYGVVAAIVPWNAPLVLSILKVAPAVACGNAIVVKPSPLAPLAVTRALRVVAEVFPPGLVSVLHGDAEVGEALVGHRLTRKVAFTGGETVGVTVARTAAGGITPVVLELGGNDPAIFLDDAPLGADVMERAVFGAFLTSGQVCMAAKRAYVPHARMDEFVSGFEAAAARVLVLGDPMDPEVTLGPMASPAQRDRVVELVDDARRRGATVTELGRATPDVDPARGWFLRPVLVTGIDDDAPLVATEQFGPALPVVGYDGLEAVLDAVNAGELGLAGSVWSADEDRAFAVAARLEAGMTFVNCHNRAGMALRAPFGGVKRSGYGREYGPEGLAEYTQTHSVHAPAAVRPGAAPVAANAYPDPR